MISLQNRDKRKLIPEPLCKLFCQTPTTDPKVSPQRRETPKNFDYPKRASPDGDALPFYTGSYDSAKKSLPMI